VERVDGTSPPSVADLAEQIRSGVRTATDVMEETLARVAELDPVVGSLVAVAENALDLARAADAAGPARGRLHGVPLAVKDNIDVAGMPTRAGSVVMPDVPARADAVAVAALRRAGAIPMAKTRMPELAYANVTPGTANPAAPGRTAGGSSGGSAAAVAAGIVPGALGTDTGGSIRCPAAFCGLVGFRPTHGLVPIGGVVLLTPTFDVVGPIARSVQDCRLLFETMRDAPSGEARLRPSPGGLAGIRLGILSEIADGARADVALAFDRAVEACRDAGALALRVSLGDPAEQTRAFAALTAVEAARIHGSATRYGAETMANLGWGRTAAAETIRSASAVRRLTTETVDRLLGQADLLVAPAAWMGAPFEEDEEVAVGGGWVRRDAAILRPTAPLSLAGVPVVTVPIHPDDQGLPLGLQLAGRRGTDDRVLTAAAAIEALVGPSPKERA
jgi:aspartyl-tRNA(Asn)/glutamyl-tRNA(Gln) amidotransferase subunit A